MATSSNSCENSSQINDDLAATESDTELQNIFKKLRVAHRTKKLPNQSRKVKKTQSRPKNCGRLPEKHKRRKILKDPTFIFTSAIRRTENKTDKNMSVKDRNDSLIPQSELQRRQLNTSALNGGPQRVQGCGEQFRNGAHVKVSDSLNMDDTTPEELAAYFDQLLHIPKPMSQMAEMMYT